MEDGLSQGSVTALLLDRNGFLWIGTHDGLNRFDGNRFQVYKHRPDDDASLADDFIRSLAEAGDGTLWVGTERGGLSRFDPATGRAERFGLSDLGPWARDAEERSGGPREGRTVHGIVPLSDGTVALASDAGLVRFDPGTGRGALVPLQGEPVDHTRTRLCGLEDGTALVGLPDGRLLRLAGGADPPVPVTTLDSAVRAVGCGAETLVATSVDVYTLDPEGGGTTPLTRVPTTPTENVLIDDILRGPLGHLWIGTTQGLHTALPGEPSSRRVGGIVGRGIPNADVTHLLVDPADGIWVGTWNGVARLHPLSRSMRRVFNRSRGVPGFRGGGVVALETAGSGSYWVGTNGGGVHLLTPGPVGDGLTLSSPDELSSFANARIYDFSRAPDGTLWIAALDNGLLRLPPAAGRAVRADVHTRDGDPAVPGAYSVLVDAAGVVWAGTEQLGLVRYDPETGVFSPYRGPTGDWDFGSRFVWPLAEDAAGTLWVGAYNGGLTRIDRDRQTHRHYGVGPGLIHEGRILTVFADSRGLVWIGTEGGGMIRFDPVSEEFSVYTTENGLPHDHVEGFAEDEAGRLWISTNDGLARFDPAAERFRVLRQNAGLAGDRFYANGALRDPTGTLLFGGPDGLTFVDPSRIPELPPAPPPTLTDFRILGEHTPLARALALEGPDLGPDERFFTFRYATLDYHDPGQLRYRHQLVGLDPGWVETGPDGSASYTSVAPGTYTFRVAARYADGEWGEEVLEVPVRVRPPFHQTWWFRSLVVLAVLTGVAGALAFRFRELHKRQTLQMAELRRRQALRLGIAGELHDMIGADLSAIALRADMVRRRGSLEEKGVEDLALVARLARKTASAVRETVWVVNTRYDSLHELVKRMHQRAGEILDGQVPYRFEVPADVPDTPVAWELRRDIYLAFSEALHNVVKHAHANAVEIMVDYADEELTVVVRDDGEGFDPDAAADGNGLGLMRSHLSRHGGRLTVESAPGSGTTVTMNVGVDGHPETPERTLVGRKAEPHRSP
jgi:signal transduction histidine kinase/ligand-binding sensor domain-containing protein